MHVDQLASRGEKLAEATEGLDSFSGLKLLHIRRKVAEILAHVGRNGMFHEYTLHDISHIDALLELQAWVVPSATWELMAPADALLQVLGVYFHDLGMLVTEDEFAARDKSDFPVFRAGRLQDPDYAAKVQELGDDKAERFLYQEYVRTNHGVRVKAWITGHAAPHLGIADALVDEVTALIAPLPLAFREDLGLVCESHHLDDLDRVDKYLVSKPYGRDNGASANVQYAAIVLRTVDLLHITSDRTPSVAFNLIAPKDPVSQQEWAKQQAVAAVRAQPALDREGNVDLEAPRETIEIFAEFSSASAFFGLSAYLEYAQRQLQQSYNWAAAAKRRHGSVFEFPWRNIDETNIESRGFLKHAFQFTLDQARVLDLLTGHTLYNNTNVVLRELVQNSLDAVRLQAAESRDGDYQPMVRITWDSKARRLRVWDNGTGMTQEVIERHLLTVGASRYQDPEFRRRYPNFSPISRFGIGILSAFMIADEVTIVTSHPEDDEARRLMLRSVHGRYLVDLLDKRTAPTKELGQHGTIVELTVRPSARLQDVRAILDTWVVVPRCEVTVSIDGAQPETVGFASIKLALEDWLNRRGIHVGTTGDRPIKVLEFAQDGLNVAIAFSWSNRYEEWSLVPAAYSPRDGDPVPLGTCVEGIRVEHGTPGYRSMCFAAMADATGPGAPKTDVARAGLEITEERTRTLESLYRLYAEQVASEIRELFDKRGFSLTWAAQEARFLMAPLTREVGTEPRLFKRSVSDIPSIVLDDGGTRRLASLQEIATIPRFWTLHSALFRSIEALFREVPTSASAGAVTEALGLTDLDFPAEPVVYGTPRDPVLGAAFQDKDVSSIVIRRAQRRADLSWESHGGEPRWSGLRPDIRGYPDLRDALAPRYADTGRAFDDVMVAKPHVQVSGHRNEAGVLVARTLYLFRHSALAAYLDRIIVRLAEEDSRDSRVAQVGVFSAVQALFLTRGQLSPADARELIQRAWYLEAGVRVHDVAARFVSPDEFADAMSAGPLEVFDPDAWLRGDPAGDAFV
jgi:molecular chaperone HtpG